MNKIGFKEIEDILEDKLELVILAASVAGGSFIVRKLFRK